jgi:hypothetical protein
MKSSFNAGNRKLIGPAFMPGYTSLSVDRPRNSAASTRSATAAEIIRGRMSST